MIERLRCAATTDWRVTVAMLRVRSQAPLKKVYIPRNRLVLRTAVSTRAAGSASSGIGKGSICRCTRSRYLSIPGSQSRATATVGPSQT